MMDEGIFAGASFPSPIESIFDKVVSIGWYDGTVSGIAFDSSHSLAFRFDLLDWGWTQNVRVFALSPLAVADFELAVNSLSQSKTPTWPIWYPSLPSSMQEKERLALELDTILARAKSPEYVFASQSRFETILAAKRLTPPARAHLPEKFDDQPNGDFDYWQKFLELSA
jgi:hypothetical protein